MRDRITQGIYSLLDYTGIMLVFHRHIKATEHYLEYHQNQMCWHEVVETIFSTRNPKKCGTKFIIDNERTYILFEKKGDTIWIINAKRK